MANRVGPKGQVVIAKEIRDQLGIGPGWLAIQRLVDDHVEIYFVVPEHNRSLAGSLAEYITDDVKNEVKNLSWEEIRQRAWAENHLRTGRGGKGGEEVMLHEPHGVEAHLVGQDALLDGFLDDSVVVKGGPLHFIS